MNPVIMRMVVDFPAPFGPRNPSTSPRPTENETPSTARFAPNIFVKFSTLIIRPAAIQTTSNGPNNRFQRKSKAVKTGSTVSGSFFDYFLPRMFNLFPEARTLHPVGPSYSGSRT
jgi:hypothetical protein